ncbi:MAG: DUF1365 domain-containing protein [Solirubrobacterales bacterium]
MTASAIYEGAVRHRRFAEAAHSFRYRMFMLYLDLEELPSLFGDVPLWSHGTRNLAWFRREDYLGDDTVDLDESVRRRAEQLTGRRPAGPIRLLAHVRTLGVCFNPLALYFCFAPGGERLETVIAEVSNTPWRERITYPLAPGEPGQMIEARHPKQMHVSPFMDMDLDYRWQLTEPGDRLWCTIETLRDDEPVFDATLALRRHELTRKRLLRSLVRYGPMSAMVVGGIHFEALRLAVKGVRYRSHPRAQETREEPSPQQGDDPHAAGMSPSMHPARPLARIPSQ